MEYVTVSGKEQKVIMEAGYPTTRESIQKLDILDKESLVNMLLDVQTGHVSCRRAAQEIVDRTSALDNRLTELKKFVGACGDCKSADALYDFVVNNLDKVEDADDTDQEKPNG